MRYGAHSGRKAIPKVTHMTIEQTIQEKGLTAPRVTPDRIQETIQLTEYHVFPGSLTTVCQITLTNGYTVIGTSACASPANFDAEIGQEIAERKAREQIWGLEGYLLKQKLYEAAL